MARPLLFLLLMAMMRALAICAESSYFKDQIVIDLRSVRSCIRFLNGTSSVGCQSDSRGNVGALVRIGKPGDVQSAIDKLPLGIHGILAMVQLNDLNSELIELLRRDEQVQGVILLDQGRDEPKRFSEDAACPNQLFSIYNEHARTAKCHAWNAPGAIHSEGLKFVNFDKPIRFVSNQTEIELLVGKCASPFNEQLRADGFRCVGRMKTFQQAAGNAKICMERQRMGYGLVAMKTLCAPLSDFNVFAMLPALNQTSTSRTDQFVLAARMDSFSTNYQGLNGDLSALTSLVSLLSAAQAVGKRLDVFKAHAKNRQLLFAFFHGESFGYVGSSRWLFEMAQERFPSAKVPTLSPEDSVRQVGVDGLSFFLELQQIGTGRELFLHTDRDIYRANRTLMESVVAMASSAKVMFVDPTRLDYGALPPSSYHSVLKQSRQVPGMLLGSFGAGQYNNNYLNSLLDVQVRNSEPNEFSEYVQRMVTAAQVGLNVSLSYVFNSTEGKLLGQFKVDEDYVRNLANCLFQYPRWDCPLILSLLNATDDVQEHRALRWTANDLYIGTGLYYNSTIRKIVHALLVNSLGQSGPAVNVHSRQQCEDQNKKQNVHTYVWQNDPKTNSSKCYRTSVYMGLAKSPAFEIEDYDLANGTYSSWMESVHEENMEPDGSLELYLKADYQLELYALLLALLVLLLSAPLNFGLREQWFMDDTLPPASPHQL